MKIIHSTGGKHKQQQPSIFTQLVTGLLSVITFAFKKPRLNRMTKPAFSDKELYWREEVKRKLQEEKEKAEAKKLAKLLDTDAEKKKKTVHRFNHNFNQKRKAQ